MAAVKVATTAKWEMKPLPELDRAGLLPRLDVGGMTGAIEQLWDAFSAQQQVTSELAADLTKHKEDSAQEMKDMRDHLYGVIDGLRDELHKTKEENREMNNALRDLLKASERETRQEIEDAKKELGDRVSDVQTQVTHNAHVANTALERALDAKTTSDENTQRISDVEDSLATDLNRLHRTLGLTKGDCRRAVDNDTCLDTMLGTPALAHILALIKDGGGGGATLSQEEKDLLHDLKSRLDRLEGVQQDMGTELRGNDRNLSTRLDKLESALKALEKSGSDVGPVVPSGAVGSDAVDAINAALSKLRNEIAQLRSGLDSVNRELGNKADAELLDKLADAHASLAHRVAALEGTLNDTRGNTDEALRLARQALRELGKLGNLPGQGGAGGHHKKSSDADATAIMMLRDALDGLTGRVASLERETGDLDAKKANRDELNKALQDVVKAMEQAIAQLYDELKRQLANLPLGAAGAEDEDGTSGRFRCLSCNRRAGPLQERYHERISKPMLPPSDTIVTPGGISPPRTSPPRAPQVPGVRDGFDPRPMTGSRRKLQTYYDWLQQKGSEQQQQQGGDLNTGLVGKTFTRGGVQQQLQREPSPTLPPMGQDSVQIHQGSAAQQQQQRERSAEGAMTSARVAIAEMPPARTESPNPATTVGMDGRHYIGIHTRNAASTLPRNLPPGGGRPQSPRAAPQQFVVTNGSSGNAAAAGGGSQSAAPPGSARPSTASSARRH